MSVPDRANERWSIDFVSKQLANGRRFRIVDVVDDYTRECVLKIIDFSNSGEQLARKRDRLSRPLPKALVCDEGPEFTGKAMFFWSKRRCGSAVHSTWKAHANAFGESFNSKFRDYCLNMNWFASIDDAKSTINLSRGHYNHVKPHRSLGGKPPATFVTEAA